MWSRFFPKEFDFFKLFNDSADLIVKAATAFEDMAEHPGNLATSVEKIKFYEHEADKITHETMTLLHKTFITPIDREDIHSLIKRLDDIIDFMDAAASRILTYDIGVIPHEVVKLSKLNSECVAYVKQVVAGLQNLKQPSELKRICIEINRLENDADEILREAVANLFRSEEDVKRIIKLKEIFELLECVSDRCEDVANVVESIVLEYA